MQLTPQTIRDAVIAVRSSKLPDPKKIANSGSFFANPIVRPEVYYAIQNDYPDVKGWPLGEQYKLAAGWLIEKAGLKDYHAHGMKTYEKQALVLVNESANDASELLAFKDEIVSAVKDKFGVTLEQEPELIA